MSIESMRREYEDHGLDVPDLPADPIEGFRIWIDDAERAGLHEPNAMVVSSVSVTGRPSSRMVLLKQLDQRGFVFYTNLRSRKGEEILARPEVAVLFPWHPLERQVRIDGTASLVDAADADAYFASRPRAAQIGAWASPQSQVVPNREFLNDRYAHESDRFAGAEQVPRPPHWSGFRVRPNVIEFWQGRPGRMHDRLVYSRLDDETWSVERLAP